MDEACCDVSCLRWFLSFRCGGSRELQTNFDELEGLLIEDAKQAVPPRVLGGCCCWLALLVVGCV